MIEKPIKAVLCDMYGTLLFEEGGLEFAYIQMAHRAHLDVEAFVRARNATFRDSLIGALPDGVRRARAILEEMGLEATDERVHEVAEAELLARMPGIHLYPTTIPTLRTLRRRGYRLGLISDCTYMWRDVLRRTGLEPLFDAITLSYEVGMLKPEPEMYLRTCRALGVQPEACAFVGDGGSQELEGAQALGITAVLIDQEWGVCREQEHPHHDYCIHTLQELLTLLPPRAAEN